MSSELHLWAIRKGNQKDEIMKPEIQIPEPVLKRMGIHEDQPTCEIDSGRLRKAHTWDRNSNALLREDYQVQLARKEGSPDWWQIYNLPTLTPARILAFDYLPPHCSNSEILNVVRFIESEIEENEERYIKLTRAIRVAMDYRIEALRKSLNECRSDTDKLKSDLRTWSATISV